MVAENADGSIVRGMNNETFNMDIDMARNVAAVGFGTGPGGEGRGGGGDGGGGSVGFGDGEGDSDGDGVVNDGRNMRVWDDRDRL